MPCCGEREKGPVGREEKWDSVVSVDMVAVTDNCKSVADFFACRIWTTSSRNRV